MNSKRRFALFAVASLLLVWLAVSLGFWQLRRATEKLTLQAAIEAQGRKPSIDAHDLRSTAAPQSLMHQPIRLSGSWVTSATVFLDNRQMDGRVGFFVVTPMLLQGGGAILVQRGWLPRNFESRSTLPAIDTPQGVVEILGRIAPPPSKLFEPGKGATGVIRQNIDLVTYRAETGLPLADVTVLQTGSPSDGLLRSWPVVGLGVEKHYGYAVQWFALGVLVSGLFLWFQIVRPFIHRSRK